MDPDKLSNQNPDTLTDTRRDLIQKLSEARLLAKSPTVFGLGGSHEYNSEAFNDSRNALAASERAKLRVVELSEQLIEINKQLGLKYDSEKLE